MKTVDRRLHVKDSGRAKPVPARIWVLLSSQSDRAVVFRRGPTAWTRLYLWDTATDALTAGSWFRGRLYEWMSDLSPDGQHLLYTARNESPEQILDAQSKYGVEMRTWTALSRPPAAHALGLWNASDGWSGGGIFVGNRAVQINHENLREQQLIGPPGFNVEPVSGGQRVDTLFHSLARTGWRVVHTPQEWIGMGEEHAVVLRKRELELRFVCSPNYRRYVVYRWLGASPVPQLEGATWADLDRRHHLLIARNGELLRVVDGQPVSRRDLNTDQPDAISKRFQAPKPA